MVSTSARTVTDLREFFGVVRKSGLVNVWGDFGDGTVDRLRVAVGRSMNSKIVANRPRKAFYLSRATVLRD